MKKLLFLLPLLALAGCSSPSATNTQTSYTCSVSSGDNASIIAMYQAKGNCVGKKAALIREGNALYQDRKDEALADIKKQIKDVDNTISIIDGLITSSIPRTFR